MSCQPHRVTSGQIKYSILLPVQNTSQKLDHSSGHSTFKQIKNSQMTGTKSKTVNDKDISTFTCHSTISCTTDRSITFYMKEPLNMHCVDSGRKIFSITNTGLIHCYTTQSCMLWGLFLFCWHSQRNLHHS